MAGKAKQLDRVELTAARVLEELRRLAFADLRSFFDAAGNLKPIATWTPEQGSQVSSFEIVKKNLVAGDGLIDTVHKFKGWDKVRSLEMLAKHFRLLVERVEVTDASDRVARLQAARTRGNK
jgi:phage terminase small subunit